ncbi:MAG: hypothetical protein KGI38_11165 [Thaumarchaeota archaeon]|nr:hypothetical protein [Nitrososphaerota archaeon]
MEREIWMEILSCVKAGAEKPTQTMYRANLSWSALKAHLAALEQGQLLREVEYRSRVRYELTEKAIGVLTTNGIGAVVPRQHARHSVECCLFGYKLVSGWRRSQKTRTY